MTDTPSPDITPNGTPPVGGAWAVASPVPMAPAEVRARFEDRMEVLTHDVGHFERLGGQHWSWFHDDGPVLLVTFEPLWRFVAGDVSLGLGHAVAGPQKWSQLCLIGDGDEWYRAPDIWRHFDRLIDDGFFDDFDRVLFYGDGPAGHAACAYAVAAPGAQVLAVRPYATLEPSRAGWDRRHVAARRLDFTSRYGYAPDMVDGAGRVVVVYDPRAGQDCAHAAQFRGPHVMHLPCPNAGAALPEVLAATGILGRMLQELAEDRLTPARFYRMWRWRRQSAPYLRELMFAAEAAGNFARAHAVCDWALRHVPTPRFRKRLARLAALAAAQGQGSAAPTQVGPLQRL